MKQFEDEFCSRLRALDSDARACARFAFTEFAMNHLASGQDLHDRLNSHPAFWNTIAAALQESAFVSLGRIYGVDRQSHNAGDLLKYAEEHSGVFSREALEARKIKGGLDTQTAKAFALEAYQPRRDSFLDLRQQFKERQEVYSAKVAPIRHKVFAHRARIDDEQREELFTNLMLRDLEDVVVFPLRMSRALFDLYHNGREPVLADVATLTPELVKQALPKGTNSWEHVHAVKDAEAFFTSLVSTGQTGGDGER